MIIVPFFKKKSARFLCRLTGKLYLRGMERRNMALGLLLCALQGWLTTAQAQEVTSVLETLDVQTGQRTVLGEFPYLIEAPNWTPDGRWIIFNRQGRIYRLPAEGQGEPVPVPTGEAVRCNNDHVLSADGRWLAVSSGRQDGGSYVFILPFSVAGDEEVTARLVTPQSPSYLHGWSPDGHWLAYCAFRDGREGDIYAIPAEGGEEVRLTTTDGLDDGPEYAPDGQHIWFNSVRSGLMQVWRMRADGSEQTQMTFSQKRNAWFPHVSPDGKWLVYLTYRKGDVEPGQHLANKDVELWLMPTGQADGGDKGAKGRNLKPRRLARLFGGQGTINTNSWAPDSRHFAFVSYKINR